MRLVLIAAGLALAACASPGPEAAPAGLQDSSYTEASGVRAIQLGAWLPAARGEVYRALTTAEGWKTWAAPSVFGDARTGGMMETSYDPQAQAGDPGNIQQQFVVLIPDRLVVFRTVRTPPGFPHAELFYRTASVFELSDETVDGQPGTRLLFTHTGFGAEPGFEELYAFFLDGDARTLEALEKRFSAR